MFNIQKIKLVDNCASVWYESRLKFDGIGLKLRFDIVWHSIKIHVDSPQSAIICVLFSVCFLLWILLDKNLPTNSISLE